MNQILIVPNSFLRKKTKEVELPNGDIEIQEVEE